MRIMLSLMACLLIIPSVALGEDGPRIIAWEEDGKIVVAMLTLEVGPRLGFHSNNKGAGGAPATYRILAEDSKVLTAEDESPLRTE